MRQKVNTRAAISTVTLLSGSIIFGYACSSEPGDTVEVGSVDDGQGTVSERRDDTAPVKPAPECPQAHPSCSRCGPDSCGQPCCAGEAERGLDDCSNHALPRWVEKVSVARLICDVEVSKGFGGATIRAYGAIEHEDTSCIHRRDAWKIVEIASVRCGGRSECEDKVSAKYLELARDGYQLMVTELDKNVCPEPRLYGGATGRPHP